MFLKDYTLETRAQSLRSSEETVEAVANLSDDIGEVLPYLASVIRACTYDHSTRTLTFHEAERTITVCPRHITIAGPGEREDVRRILDALKDLINRVYEGLEITGPCQNCEVASLQRENS